MNREECAASLTVSEDEIKVLREGIHTCAPSKSSNKMHLKYENCKKNVCEKFKPIKEIFEECLENSSGDSDDDDSRLTFETKRRTLQRLRKDFLEVKATRFGTLGEVELPKLLKDQFLLWENGTDDFFFVFGTDPWGSNIEGLC